MLKNSVQSPNSVFHFLMSQNGFFVIFKRIQKSNLHILLKLWWLSETSTGKSGKCKWNASQGYKMVWQREKLSVGFIIKSIIQKH